MAALIKAFVVAELLLLAAAVPAPDPMITPSPSLNNPSRTVLGKRDLLSDIAGGVNSVISGLGSAIPSYVASGVPNFFQDFPTEDKVQSSLGLNDEQVRALPTQVLNVPPYGNWSNGAWNVRFHGNVYKQPNASNETIDKQANVFLIGTEVKDLPPDQQAQARNMTSSIFVIQQGDQRVNMHLEPVFSTSNRSSQGGGAGTQPTTGGVQDITLPDPTTSQGDFDAFVPIALNGLTPGNATNRVQRLNVYANGSSIGNATAYLVPPTGLTIISDIDDILRVTKIYVPKEGLLNSFARPFTPWMNMPAVYANWQQTLPDAHFHYLTTTPEQVTRNYMEFIYKTYPLGSFDTRPLNFSDVSATLKIRRFLLDKIFRTFPQRKFVLVADTSNSDVMRDYPAMAKDYPGQVACILLRNTSATDPDNKFPYDTSGFKDLNQSSYMFFRTPEDLNGINLETGCYNASVKQNVTFGTQAEALGLKGAAGRLASGGMGVVAFFAFAVSLFVSM